MTIYFFSDFQTEFDIKLSQTTFFWTTFVRLIDFFSDAFKVSHKTRKT